MRKLVLPMMLLCMCLLFLFSDYAFATETWTPDFSLPFSYGGVTYEGVVAYKADVPGAGTIYNAHYFNKDTGFKLSYASDIGELIIQNASALLNVYSYTDTPTYWVYTGSPPLGTGQGYFGQSQYASYMHSSENIYNSDNSIYFLADVMTPNASDHFTWPIDAQNSSSGHFGWCSDWRKDAAGCYWLNDTSTDQATVWRDVQPFQVHYWKYKNISGRHLGADYNIKSGDIDRGEFVYAVGKGVISKVDKQPSWGNIIYIKHDTSFGPYTSIYAHVDFLESGPPVETTPVDMGTPIARVGNGTWNKCTNNNSCKLVPGAWPAHLHFEIREGDSTYQGIGYTKCKNADDTSAACIMTRRPEGQIDPNDFISTHR